MPDPMMPPVEDIENCILGICCDPKRRRSALAKRLAGELHLKDDVAEKVANWVNDNYDLGPHGMLMPLFTYIAALAREYPYQG
jgi:hypothetical protein